MEKNINVNVNANANANTDQETSPDRQHHGGERSPMVVSSPPPVFARNNDDTNVVVAAPTVVIELPSSSDMPSVAATIVPESGRAGDETSRGAETEGDVVGTSSYGGMGWEGEQGKKRGRGDGGEQQQQVKAAKKKGELTEVPKGEPRCATCNKVFKSWKALFGHLRSHPERSYRGALPPPTAAELDMRRCQHQLASTLLTVAQEVESRRGLDIDLNQPSAAEQDGPSPENRTAVPFDLNFEPPPESDDED